MMAETRKQDEGQSAVAQTAIPPTQLEVLLTAATPDEKKQLMADMGIAERTWFRYKLCPGMIPAQSMVAIEAFLERKHGRIIPLRELLAPAA